MCSIVSTFKTTSRDEAEYSPPTISAILQRACPDNKLLAPDCVWDVFEFGTRKQLAVILLTTKMFAPAGKATYPEPSNEIITEKEFLKKVAETPFHLLYFLDGVSVLDGRAFDIAAGKKNASFQFNPLEIENPRIAAAFEAHILSNNYQEMYNANKGLFSDKNIEFIDDLVKANAASTPHPASPAPSVAAGCGAFEHATLRADFEQLRVEVAALKRALDEERAAAKAACEALQRAQLREGKLRGAVAAIAGQLSASN